MKEPSSLPIRKHGPTSHAGRLPLGAKSSSYVLAELCYQREDFKKAFQITQKRVDRNRTDFRALNLMGACLGQLGAFDDAETLFERVSKMRKSCDLKHKARFNLGLVQLCRDLALWGDCTVAATLNATPGAHSGGDCCTNGLPFQKALATWKSLLMVKSPYSHVFLTYDAFARLQFGDMDGALAAIMTCLDISENFYASHYTLGRILMDLYQLQLEGQGFPLTSQAIDFLEIEPSELIDRTDERGEVCHETLLELALQAFLEARELNPFSPVVALALCYVFLAADLPDEAREHLIFAENLVGDALPILNAQLAFTEKYDPEETSIKPIVTRIQNQRRHTRSPDIRFIIPQHFLV